MDVLAGFLLVYDSMSPSIRAIDLYASHPSPGSVSLSPLVPSVGGCTGYIHAEEWGAENVLKTHADRAEQKVLQP